MCRLAWKNSKAAAAMLAGTESPGVMCHCRTGGSSWEMVRYQVEVSAGLIALPSNHDVRKKKVQGSCLVGIRVEDYAANGKDVRRCTPIADNADVNACIGILLVRCPVSTTAKRSGLDRQHYRQNTFVPFGAPGYVGPLARTGKSHQRPQTTHPSHTFTAGIFTPKGSGVAGKRPAAAAAKDEAPTTEGSRRRDPVPLEIRRTRLQNSHQKSYRDVPTFVRPMFRPRTFNWAVVDPPSIRRSTKAPLRQQQFGVSSVMVAAGMQ